MWLAQRKCRHTHINTHTRTRTHAQTVGIKHKSFHSACWPRNKKKKRKKKPKIQTNVFQVKDVRQVPAGPRPLPPLHVCTQTTVNVQ